MADYEQNNAPVLSSEEIDAIGEILNISMGSAATAISTMLDRQVIITTPKVELQKFHDVSYAALEPAILVKIEYVEGISGANVMVFRQSDMQVILNLLMGNDEAPSEDFVFDELSMSAACEVMNQMMGASATALSDFLGKTINISTPEATVMDAEHPFESALALESEDKIVSVAFNLDIQGVMDSEFMSVITSELAKTIVNQVMGTDSKQESAAAAQQQPVEPEKPASAPTPTAPAAAAPPPQSAQQQPQMPPAQQQQQAPPPAMGQPPQMPPMGQPQMPYPQQPGADWQQQMPYGMQMPYPAYGYPPYGYMQAPPPQEEPGGIKSGPSVNVQAAKFPNFGMPTAPVLASPLSSNNMELMMNVPLNVAVEIGKTKKKIREIMDFNQGTVIELEKQAGAPVDIVVNGQLIARGDVVVVDDNFGVRITEIVGTKELIESIENHR